MSKNNNKVRVVIVGGGPAGMMTAIQAIERLSSSNPIEILMFEQSDKLGGSPWLHSGKDVRTNVPVWGMSIDLGDGFGNDFNNWLQTTDRSGWQGNHRSEVFDKGSFPPRYIVGKYVSQRFSESVGRTNSAGGDRRHIDFKTYAGIEITSIDPDKKTLTFGNGAEITADLFVLAVGPGPLSEPESIANIIGTPGYIVPFVEGGMDKLNAIGPEEDLLILGSGQTAGDIVKIRYCQLRSAIERGDTDTLGKATLVSRNGFMHRPYSEENPFPRRETYRGGQCYKTDEVFHKIGSDDGVIDLEKFFALIDSTFEKHGETGIANIEAVLPTVWEKLTTTQREELISNKRLLTISRTGSEPGVGEATAALEDAGLLELRAANIQSVTLSNGRYVAETGDERTITGNKIVNAMGTDYLKLPSIYKSLVEKGYSRIHPSTGLGIDAKSRSGALINKSGEESEVFFAVGASRIGQVLADTGVIFGPSQAFVTIREHAHHVGVQLMFSARNLAKTRDVDLSLLPKTLNANRVEIQGTVNLSPI